MCQPTDTRDPLDKQGDMYLEAASTATFFAIVLAHGRPEDLTLEEIKDMARRWLADSTPRQRYFGGKPVPPCATEARQ